VKARAAIAHCSTVSPSILARISSSDCAPASSCGARALQRELLDDLKCLRPLQSLKSPARARRRASGRPREGEGPPVWV